MSEDEWPPRFKYTPEGLAGRFIVAHSQIPWSDMTARREAADMLVELFKMFYEEGLKSKES